jgi:hypothetical protein
LLLETIRNTGLNAIGSNNRYKTSTLENTTSIVFNIRDGLARICNSKPILAIVSVVYKKLVLLKLYTY